jgi:hypothetical protein
MRRTRSLVLVPVVALLVVGLWSLPAAATDQETEWSQGNYVGHCTSGLKSGGYVWSVQSILWSAGLLSSSQLDGLWGPITESATKTWQSRHSLGADGCWGPNTWYKAQHGYDNVNVGGEVVRYYHMTYLGTSTWSYEERNAGRNVSYRNVYYNTITCWQVNPPGDKSWTLVSDPGDGTCNGQ